MAKRMLSSRFRALTEPPGIRDQFSGPGFYVLCSFYSWSLALRRSQAEGEETGYKAGSITYLGSIATAPGFCDEIIHLYKAENLSLGTKCCDEDEFTSIKTFSLDEVKAMVKSGEIIDTKTITILAYL